MITTYREALRDALRDEMRADARVVVMGEEVGRYGGAYGVTKGLFEEFGDARVLDTPISEAGIIGAAIGAAMTGLRPVAELMYVDFMGLAMDQIANQAAKIRYMFGGQIGVPMVLRTQGGTGRSAGAQHSQSLEAHFMHTPGLRVAMPSTVTDAYALLRAAVRSDDPVVFIEHKALYTSKGELDPGGALPFGQAAVMRRGTDVTIVSYSRMLWYALEAAERLAEDGIEAEVIDLRSLWPWDRDAVIASTQRTGALLVAHEAVQAAGFGAEVAASVAEATGLPVARIGAPRLPVGYAAVLEAQAHVTPAKIAERARALLARPGAQRKPA